MKMKHLDIFEKFKGKRDGKIHTLSGIALVVENRILLVKPKKYKGTDDKWSIPKGHIEGGDSLRSALKELREETGIQLYEDTYDDIIYIDYQKAGVSKVLDVFVYYVDKDDVQKYIKPSSWEIMSHHFDTGEIMIAKFFKATTAQQKLEVGMLGILKKLF